MKRGMCFVFADDRYLFESVATRLIARAYQNLATARAQSGSTSRLKLSLPWSTDSESGGEKCSC